MRRSIIAGIGMLSLIGVLLMLQLTTPSGVGLFGVLIVFILIYIFFGCLFYLLLSSLAKLLGKILPPGKWKVSMSSISDIKVYYFSSFLSLAPVILIGMNSIGTVGVTDIVLLVIFEVLGCLYIYRRF